MKVCKCGCGNQVLKANHDYIYNHHRSKSLDVRFWQRVNKTDSCWLWTGSKTARGYGQIAINQKPVTTHRLSWELAFGSIPDGMYVCHRCDVRNCVRPDHLFLGTQADNIRDCSEKGRMHIGEANGTAKLNESIVRDIRIKFKESKMSYAELAADFNISLTTAWNIINCKTWKHV